MVEVLHALVETKGKSQERLTVIRTVESQPRTHYTLSNAAASVPVEEIVGAHDDRLRIEEMFELGNGDVAVGTVKAVEAGVLDSPMSINIHAADKVLGIRDNDGACRYLDFGNLPIPEDIKAFHRQKAAEREKAEGRTMDYYTSIEDFWAISKGRLKGIPEQ